ncbi:MAG: TlpA family protein disulfide reductase [Bacteroidetes bacterium]|nr:TlpA family protein disulfide reductase [Bacteroidota bacterium]
MSEKKKPARRALIEWAALIGIVLLLFTTGAATAIQSRLQQAILWTGLIRPTIELATDNQPDADLSVRLTTLEGEPLSLTAFEGKTVFINVWATWCAPCLAEMPNIHSLYQQVASDAIVFVMINVDEEVDVVRQFVEQKGYTFPVYRLTHPLPAVYDSAVLPTTYVIAPNGKLVTKHVGMAQYDTDAFKAYLRQLSASS